MHNWGLRFDSGNKKKKKKSYVISLSDAYDIDIKFQW